MTQSTGPTAPHTFPVAPGFYQINRTDVLSASTDTPAAFEAMEDEWKRAQSSIEDRPEPAQRPDPTKTGPCELKLSFACTGAGYERLDPRDMLTPETSFRTPVIACVECYEMAADHYLKELHS